MQLNGGVLSLYKDLEVPHCSNVFYQPMWSQSLRNAGCTHIVSAVFWYALLCKFSPVCAHSSALCNNEIVNYRNKTVIHIVNIFYYIPTATFYCTGYTACWSNTQNYFWMQHKMNNKRPDMNTFLNTLPKNIQHGNYCITCTTNMVQAKYYYMIHLQLTRQFYEHCNTSVMNKSYLLFRIPWKREGCIFTIYVTVLTPSGIAYLPRHSNGNILK